MKHAMSAVALASLAGAASAQTLPNITLFGQEYTVHRFDYSLQVAFTSPATNLPASLVEVEGTHYLPPDRLIFSTDALGEVFPDEAKNHVIEARLLLDDTGQPTGLEYVRTILASDPAGGFDLDPAGVTINPETVGLGAGGNLVIGSSRERLRAFSLAAGAPLGAPTGPCPSGDCSIAVTSSNDTEDVAFVPGFGARTPAFYVLNQEFPDQAQRLSLLGQLEDAPGLPFRSFNIGGDAPGVTANLTPKGLAFAADAPAIPAAIRRPGGVLLVALDNDLPGVQAFDFAGNLLAFEPLTVGGVPDGASRLALGDCGNQLQLESLAVDAASGRLFLTNQGDGLTCNFLFVLTPVAPAPACNVADIVSIGGFPPADGELTVDDYTSFINAFAGDDLLADIVSIGGFPPADGELTVDDYTSFINAFAEGC